MKINLQELIEKSIISEDVAHSIESYYAKQSEASPNRVLLVFSVLGALLIGLGIILIIGHNWDNFPRYIKTTISFLPLIITQLVAFYVLIKKPTNHYWKEGSAVALFCAIGASIALVSQVYHIIGDLSSYTLTWMVLAVPLIYILDSKAVLAFVIIGITSYAQQVGLNYPRETPYMYWLVLASILPFCYSVYKHYANSLSFSITLWLLLISIAVGMTTLSSDYIESFFLMFISYFTFLYLVGNEYEDQVDHLFKNPFKVIGFLGTIILLLMTSFDFYWSDMASSQTKEILINPTTWMCILLSCVSGYLLIKQIGQNNKIIFNPLNYCSFIFLLFFLLSFINPIASQFGVNFLLLGIAVSMIWRGHDLLKLHLLNLGLLVLAALIVCRFFDTNISFVIRGIIFVLLGISFFIANYLIIKKKKTHES